MLCKRELDKNTMIYWHISYGLVRLDQIPNLVRDFFAEELEILMKTHYQTMDNSIFFTYNFISEKFVGPNEMVSLSE